MRSLIYDLTIKPIIKAIKAIIEIIVKASTKLKGRRTAMAQLTWTCRNKYNWVIAQGIN